MSQAHNYNAEDAVSYWKKVDELAALKEKQRILESVSKSDTEKFFLFTKMLRLHNTFQKIKVQP